MVALKLNGYSMNSTNPDELNAARDSLIAQKPLVPVSYTHLDVYKRQVYTSIQFFSSCTI